MQDKILLKRFEIEVLTRLCEGTPFAPLVSLLSVEGKLVDLHFTGKGYFITLTHSALPVARTVLDIPGVNGIAEEFLTGFVVFIENKELTLECFSYGDTIPRTYRDLDVMIS